MKKLYFILSSFIVAVVMVFAGDTIKVMRIYHNGTFSAIPLAYIDSIDHSANNTTSIIEAIDSTYNIPISEIDSVVITEADINEYNNNVEEIRQHLIAQKELPIDQYQQELLEWLNNCGYVSKATITELKNKIIVMFQNGLYFHVNFVDLLQYSDDDSEENDGARRTDNTPTHQKYFDVSYLDGEEIVNPNIIYIQGRSMPRFRTEKEYSNAVSEWTELYLSYDSSPVSGSIKRYSKTLDVFDEEFSEYGLIIVSQTHGDDGRSGAFQIEDKAKPLEKGWSLGINVYKNGQEVCQTHQEEPFVYWIYPKYFGNKLCKNLVYAAHCYSYDLYKAGIKSTKGFSTFYGFDTSTTYYYDYGKFTPAKDSLIVRMKKFFNGYAYKDAVWLKSYNVNGYIEIPKINNPDSKHRLFSIKTEDIEVGEGIKGKINGFQNLKKDVKYMLYVHEGREKFTPEDSDVEKIENAVNPGTDGCFTISSDIVNQYPDHAFIVGFEYADKVYYGEMKTVGIELCPDDNHPHAIDLGLPSGTKWACCNVASEPEDQRPEYYGGYYAWGETQTKEMYNYVTYQWYNDKTGYVNIGIDIAGTQYDAASANWGSLWHTPTMSQCEELINHTTSIWTKCKGVFGELFTSKNGNSIFLPAAGYCWDNVVYNSETGGYYRSSSLDEAFPIILMGSWELGINPANTSIYGGSRVAGLSVRPVWE